MPHAFASTLRKFKTRQGAAGQFYSLPELARRASLAAERTAIQDVLDRMRWNRRKAAQALGVSYKTLLNKMKECGITAPQD